MTRPPLRVVQGRKPSSENRPRWRETSGAPGSSNQRKFWTRRRRKDAVLFALSLVILAYFAGGRYLLPDPFEKPGEAISALDIRVVDGDTIDLRGERIRLPNLDAPEMPGRAACREEGELALQAKAKLAETLRTGPLILLHRQTMTSRDQYGRTLARITVDGIDVSKTLRQAGVARLYGFGWGWC